MDRKELDLRLERLRKSPRNWTYWVAAFTTANGIFTALDINIAIVAGFTSAFALAGSLPHLIIGGLIAACAYFSNMAPKILFVPLFAYIIDALSTAFVQLWLGLVMHIVVLGFVGFSLLRVRSLESLQAQHARVDG